MKTATIKRGDKMTIAKSENKNGHEFKTGEKVEILFYSDEKTITAVNEKGKMQIVRREDLC